MFPPGWVYFSDNVDLLFALSGGVLILLMLIWWRQQIRTWSRVVLATLLAAMLLSTASYYIFEVPPYTAGCPEGCTGYRGYPLPVALVTIEGRSIIAPVDFLLNLLLIWLLWLTASVIWSLLAVAFDWERRALRWRIFFVIVISLLPWALLPRILNPPQPPVTGEDLRIAINGRRAAEFTYRVTGLWVQRLALEDVKRTLIGEIGADINTPLNQVCLRGYTYFFIPWRRYRVDLDPNGLTPLALSEMGLEEKCW